MGKHVLPRRRPRMCFMVKDMSKSTKDIRYTMIFRSFYCEAKRKAQGTHFPPGVWGDTPTSPFSSLPHGFRARITSRLIACSTQCSRFAVCTISNPAFSNSRTSPSRRVTCVLKLIASTPPGFQHVNPARQSRRNRAADGILSARRAFLHAVRRVRHHQMHAVRLEQRLRLARIAADQAQRPRVAVLKMFRRVGKHKLVFPPRRPGRAP